MIGLRYGQRDLAGMSDGLNKRNFNVVIGHRPLTEEQKTYAATDAHCLLEIFNIFHFKVAEKGLELRNSFCSATEQRFSNVDCGLKQILENPDICHKLLRSKFFDAVDIVRATTSEFPQRKATLEEVVSWSSCRNTIPMDDSLFSIVRKYGERILLKESDRKPKTKKKGKNNLQQFAKRSK
ncbi:hypothetical protein CK203_077239 [Vitis vinifera]|uniref:Uncharacterized protein n=1 Tax=Vitis vinifera TaxID=29760 RepID=A0A438BUD8_VITVI|nr:hypothetical protein CK203_077239 [Vitis vinifera]